MSGFPSPFWLTFEQAKIKKIYLEPNQQYTPIVKWIIDEDEKGKMVFRGCRYFRVYNLSQFKNWESIKTPDSDIPTPATEEIELPENNLIEDCERIIAGYKNSPTINKNGNRAYYVPSIDSVTVPSISSFVSSEHYYATMIHELVHSTGHEKRLKRKGIAEGMDGFGGKNYSFEELVAEIGACFLCNMIGIDSEKVFDNSIAYIQSWLGKFNDDVTMLPKAAQMAQKAVDLILGKEYKKETEESENED
jgi:antirestriction protein ArdC